MAMNKTNQEITLLYLTAADSRRVNLRFQDIRQVGIYKGMYCTNPSGFNVSLSAGVCEISDGDYQVRVKTTSVTTGITAEVGKYLVLRWAYTGDEDADILNAFSVATPATNDIVLALVGGSSGNLTFDYGDATYPRTQPNTLDLYLKVESTGETEKYVRVRAGRIQTNEAVVEIADQKILLDACPTNTRIDLIYITAAGLVAVVKGTASASPTVPNYDGRRVLAEVTLTTGYTSIPQTSIKDVRNFVTLPAVPDDITIERSSAGKLQVKAVSSFFMPAAYVGGESITFPNGLIMKMGYKAFSGLTTIILFEDAFPTGIVSAVGTPEHTSYGDWENVTVSNLSKTGITFIQQAETHTGMRWMAIGY